MRTTMTHLTRAAAIAIAIGCGLFLAAPALAQGPGGRQQPFSSTYQRPTLSPYVMLGTSMNTGGQVTAQGTFTNPLIYQQLIQPQIQQQQQQVTQLKQGNQINRLQNQVQQIQRGTMGRQVSATIRPTGHASTYLNKSHFYPRK